MAVRIESSGCEGWAKYTHKTRWIFETIREETMK
jgi:hypothetical protein